MALPLHLRLVLSQAVEMQSVSRSIVNTRINPGIIANRTLSRRTFYTAQHRTALTLHYPSLSALTWRQTSIPNNSFAVTKKFSSAPIPPSESSPAAAPTAAPKSTSDPFSEVGSSNKSIFAKLWDRYSFEGQTKRIILGERLFRSAQIRANDVRWYREGRIPYEFRPRHAILTMHVWFLHKRLLADRVDPHAALLVQEELFDILWNDTRARIRAEGVNELTVNKHLKDAQQLTFLHCTHYDHAFQEYAKDPKKRVEELAAAIWVHVLNRDEEGYNDQLRRMSAYVEYQFMNIVLQCPDEYFWEGRIPWGDVPDFTQMLDNSDKVLEEVTENPKGFEVLPEHWVKTLTDAGDTYYWNQETDETSWKRPV